MDRRTQPRPVPRAFTPLRDFAATESAGAVLLALGALAALVWANSPWSGGYERLWQHVVTVGFGDHSVALDLRHWVNDGLMAVFFLVVGLEIEREVRDGHLSTRRTALLPGLAALGGMLVPALLYLAIAGSTAPRGWAIPVATDIALALGVVAVAGDRLPSSLRAFLLGLAIVDDIGAIVIIAVVYSSGIDVVWLAVAALAIAGVALGRRLGVRRWWWYVALGLVLWLAFLEAGIHPTLAGVIMGLLAPRPEWLEDRLHPWTSFAIVPVFALANSGIELSLDGVRDALGSPILWGVLVGLVVGKTLGVVGATVIAVRTGLADRPAGARRRHVVGVGSAAGIGFTVALFIAELAFRDADSVDDAKLGILVASVLAAIVSTVLLRGRGNPEQSETPPELHHDLGAEHRGELRLE